MRLDHVVAVVVAVAMLSASVPVATPTAATQSPAVSVHVDNEPLDRGDDYHTPTDPWVRVTVDADAPVSLVEVRVDGETRHVFEPDAESVERSVRLDLETGPRRVQVVAKADGVTTHEATIVKDDVAPVVNYSAPFAADADDPDAPPADELTVNRANVSVDGTLTDLSTVDAVRIEHRYDYRRVGADETTRTDRREYLLARPASTFTQPLYLAPGANDITVHAEDAVGNRRTHRFTVIVEDDTPPTLNVTDVDWVSPTRLRIEGRASDRVQVDAVWTETDNATAGDVDTTAPDRHPLVFPRPTDPDRDRRTVAFDTTVYHPPNTDHVVVGVNDTAGNRRTANLSLWSYLAPNVSVDDRATGYVDDRTVAVGGRVTDGQVDSVSVETVDPATGDVVDIRRVDLENGTFATRLGGAANATQVRIRARDASGAERLRNVTVAAPADPNPSTDGANGSSGDASDGTADGADDGGEAGDADGREDGTADTDGDGASTIRVPVVGIAVPIPTLPAPLTATLSLPIPVVGPVAVPVVPSGVLGVAVGAIAWRRW